MELDFSKPAPKPDTLEGCHALIEALWGFCASFEQRFEKAIDDLKIDLTMLRKENADLKAEVIILRKENSDLKEKLNLNSRNSSKPPSSNFFKTRKAKMKAKKKSNRKQGAQPG